MNLDGHNQHQRDATSSAASGPPEGDSVSLLLRVGEFMDLFLQHVILRLKFSYLLLESRVLRLQLSNLSERNRQLKLRLLGLRGWHVQLPPSQDAATAAGIEHEPKAGAGLEPRVAGRFQGGETSVVASVTPNVANNRIAADREAGCCNSG